MLWRTFFVVCVYFNLQLLQAGTWIGNGVGANNLGALVFCQRMTGFVFMLLFLQNLMDSRVAGDGGCSKRVEYTWHTLALVSERPTP